MLLLSKVSVKYGGLHPNLTGKVLKQFHTTSRLALNPLLPIDPTEILTELNDEEKARNEEEIKRVKGRIKSILHKPKKTINGSKNTDRKGTSSTSGSNGSNGSNNGGNGKGNGNSDGPKLNKNGNGYWKQFLGIVRKCTEAGLITMASLGVLVLGGILYHKIYKRNVLWKMDDSFDNHESLMLLKHQENVGNSDKELWAERVNQKWIDEIVTGKIKGKYYLLLGEKGTGKTSTVMESINRVDGKDCVVVDCSSDNELMRLRIGNALNFEFSEDYIGSLFSMKGPRESTPILDIERAFMKLEKVLIERRRKTKKPLILTFNNSHLVDSSIVELLQQKAETFSSSGMLTMIFISDDYWLFEKLKTFATRLQVINFEDTQLEEASKILKSSRIKFFQESLDDQKCEAIYNIIGGRPQHLNHVASQWDVFDAAHKLIDSEKLWFLNNCALLGADMDDDVMESGKFATSAMLLMRELVEMDRDRNENKSTTEFSKLPQLPLWRARQVMTRPDYIEKYDKMNIFTIGTDSNVRADSVPMMRAFHEIASDPKFDSLLRETIDRISEIESLGRTRELIFKDLTSKGQYVLHKDPNSHDMLISVKTADENKIEESIVNIQNQEERSSDDDLHHEGEKKKWWKRRLETYSQSGKGIEK